MRLVKLVYIMAFIGFSGTSYSQTGNIKNTVDNQKPKISFSFDDGSIEDMPGYKLEEWNQMLLNSLKKHQLKAVLFVAGRRLTGDRGRYVLDAWDNAGHKIANHTWSHYYISSKKITLEDFEKDVLVNDSFIRKYKNFYPYFRFPYLKEGNTAREVNGFRGFLKEHDYKTGHVTIDASDWYVSNRLVTRLKEKPDADISGFEKFYIQHLFDRASFYDSLATCLTNRKIAHVILLHHNLAAALFLDDLIHYFKENGWEVMDTEEAYKDEIYRQQPTNLPAGESLIWALAKQSGKYDRVLRYPGEDGEYEKVKMDKSGL
jgi:peptidoglycan-N-acetylglucosamine deacetylase